MWKWILIPIALGLSLLLMAATNGFAKSVTVKMYRVAPKGHGVSIGTIELTDTKYGMLIIPNLHNVPPGLHGFHVHLNPSCGDNGHAAGDHYDPKKTGKHLGPYNSSGHLGDLPAITVDRDGDADLPVLAPRLKVSQVVGHALIFHVGGDNYSDVPEKLGGGGGRLACGLIE